ncbi:hypothetical protein GCM10027570_05780 [Streptomonospora sediminis]
MTGPRQARRTSAHLVLVDAAGRAVLPQGQEPGGEHLPGDRVRFGDDPAAVARAAAGLPAEVPVEPCEIRTELAGAGTAGGPVDLHIDRLYYTAPVSAAPSAPAGRSVPVRAAVALPARPSAEELAEDEPGGQQQEAGEEATAGERSGAAPGGPVLRRFSCYGVVTDPAGRILLSRIAPGFPGAGTWHPPGGGVDHGETARAALRREVAEETDQDCGVGELIAITHHRRTRELGPQSPQTDVYAVWVFFHAHVADPRPLQVVEVGGSTEDCAWFGAEDLTGIPLSATARWAFTELSRIGSAAL